MKGPKADSFPTKTRSVLPNSSTRIEKRCAPRLQRLSRVLTSTTASSLYSWVPVDKHRKEIRVLDLYAGIGDAPLQGHLRCIFLEAPTKHVFETISYAWEDPALVENISVDGASIPIPESAASALRCMRLPDKKRTLWIDCVCIDQADDLEKGHQVGLMADIYTNSCGTLIFLGDYSDIGKRAFDSITAIYHALEDVEGDTISWDEERGLLNLDAIQTIKIDDWPATRGEVDGVAIYSIMSRPYWGRLWVVQEGILSKKSTLCCGSARLELNHFLVAITWLYSSNGSYVRHRSHIRRSLLPSEVDSFLDVARLARTYSKQGHDFLASMLLNSRKLGFSNPLDRVYGLLGLLKLSNATQPLLPSLEPDYTRSAVDVFCDVTRECIKQHWGYDFLVALGNKRTSRTEMEGLPTWVPNWYAYQHREDASPFPLEFMLWKLYGYPDRDTEFAISHATHDPKIFTTQIATVDSILHHSTEIIQDRIARGFESLDRFMQGARDLLSDTTSYVATQSVELRLEELLAFEFRASGTDTVWGELRRARSICTCPQYSRSLGFPYMQATRPKGCACGLASARVVDAMNHFFSRKLFITQSGELGIGPTALRDGDVIVATRVSYHPLVLRRAHSHSTDSYTVVGQAHVGGIKDGTTIFKHALQTGGLRTIHLV